MTTQEQDVIGEFALTGETNELAKTVVREIAGDISVGIGFVLNEAFTQTRQNAGKPRKPRFNQPNMEYKRRQKIRRAEERQRKDLEITVAADVCLQNLAELSRRINVPFDDLLRSRGRNREEYGLDVLLLELHRLHGQKAVRIATEYESSRLRHAIARGRKQAMTATDLLTQIQADVQALRYDVKRLRERFPDDADVTDAVERFLDSATDESTGQNPR